MTTQQNITPKPVTFSQRLECNICHYHLDANDKTQLTTVNCNVRAFLTEQFHVWRCPNCETIHCLEIVDLDRYYAPYPVAQAQFSPPYRIFYGNLHQRLCKHGFSPHHSLLDYGCGVNGLFVRYLQQQGFPNCYGYDPYAPPEGFGNPDGLKQKTFDYIILQDVIEHLEDPIELLRQLDSYLASGGYILIGTPNSDRLDLDKPNISDFYNGIHAPYHLHLYTRTSLELLGRDQGWETIDFFDRAYNDTPWLGLNNRALNVYQRGFDGSLDVWYNAIEFWKFLASPNFLIFIFYAIFGYWLSFHTEMAVMFRKGVSH
jgi:SAM-dependent methyltransferase